MMNVLFRTDASLQIGTGHVMRCLTLANALRERGAECRFICRAHEGNLLYRIQQNGFVATALPADFRPNKEKESGQTVLPNANWHGADWQTDAAQTISSLGDSRPDWLIVDHYELDTHWESALRPHCGRIMVIDDLADRDHDCDVILDQNLVAEMEYRYDERVPARCASLIGPEYALLQPQYAELHPRTPPHMGSIRRILVFFGGADNHNMTGRVIAAFLALRRADITLDVVINPSSPHAAAIHEQAHAHANITLHESLPSLAPLMLMVDYAIGAGGATSWERCCLGLPSLVITLAENQKSIAAELDRQGFVRWLGDQDTVTESMLNAVLQDVLEHEGILAWSRRRMELVDGKGTERVVAVLSLSIESRLKARLARLDDETVILRWANDPIERQNSYNSNTIDPESHRTCFYKRLRNPECCRIYIVETEQGLSIGQVCFERNDSGWEIHYSIDAMARDLKLGAKMFQTAMQAFRHSISGALRFGRVKQDNRPSQKVFEHLGITAKRGGASLSIAICSDSGSWINESIPQLLLGWLAAGHQCAWVHSDNELSGGDICFFLSYGRIVDRSNREKYRNNLVVHAGDLPKGRGWSPTSWMILEGEERIPVTLLEAVDDVDAGPIYAQEWFNLQSTDLVDQWRTKLAEATARLATDFVAGFPESIKTARPQDGGPTYYPKRLPKDSELHVDQTLREQFNLFRIVDNEHYPAYFSNGGKEFVLKIFERDQVIK
jgi:UDP-2,4-diacetamido-2,4,6-trideoxy-beta-L-altropyranose hydrolase